MSSYVGKGEKERGRAGSSAVIYVEIYSANLIINPQGRLPCGSYAVTSNYETMVEDEQRLVDEDGDDVKISIWKMNSNAYIRWHSSRVTESLPPVSVWGGGGGWFSFT